MCARRHFSRDRPVKPEDDATRKMATLANPTETEAPDQPIPIDTPRTRSTGPKTEAGKKRSSQNSFKHGLSGRTVVMPCEDMELFLKHSKEIVEGYNPETAIECELAQEIADGYWRLKRARTVEDGMFAWGNYEEAGNFDADNELVHAAFTAAKAFRTNSNAFVNLSIYEQRIRRGIDKAMIQLREIQAERKALRAEALAEAIRLRQLDNMLAANAESSREATDGARQTDNLSPGSAVEAKVYRVDQFVYSSEQIDAAIVNRNRCTAALRAEKLGFNYRKFIQEGMKGAA